MYIYIIYLFCARYLHNDIFKYVTCDHIVLSHGCLAQAHYQSSYSKRDWCTSFLGFYSYVYSSGSYQPG